MIEQVLLIENSTNFSIKYKCNIFTFPRLPCREHYTSIMYNVGTLILSRYQLLQTFRNLLTMLDLIRLTLTHIQKSLTIIKKFKYFHQQQRPLLLNIGSKSLSYRTVVKYMGSDPDGRNKCLCKNMQIRQDQDSRFADSCNFIWIGIRLNNGSSTNTVYSSI